MEDTKPLNVLPTDTQDNNEEAATDNSPKFGSGPSGPIADGGNGEAKQPKEQTGKDAVMGGSCGGTAGMGISKD